MLTHEEEIELARASAEKGLKAAHLASIGKWYRNTQRNNYISRFSQSDTCALCIYWKKERVFVYNYCRECVMYDGLVCCEEWRKAAVKGTTEAALTLLDKLALTYVEKYGETITVGPYTYYLG